ncbi:MAG TPA: adenylosuccinate lyase [Planctomycetota bacterium]|nr:adenylosuccinate lyase [Planctomycetota bacterium]
MIPDMSHATDSVLYRDMFGTTEMRAIFSDRGLVQRWLDVEAALAQAEAEVGIVPADAAAKIKAAARVENINWEELSRGANLVGYPILSLVKQIEKATGPEAGKYIHWGATTQDIMDSANALQVRDARRLLTADLEKIIEKFASLAVVHRNTIMAGRTHGQQALPITFGYKLAVYVAELRRHQERLEATPKRCEFVEFAGAAGTLATVGEKGLDVQRRMAAILDLNVPPISWHTSRDGLAEFVCVLGMMASTLGKFAQEIALLQRTEIAEVEEGFVPGRGGSSTMPQKRNPIASEAIIGASKVVRQLVPAMLDAMLPDNERATGPWHTEWLALPEAAVLTHGIFHKTLEILNGLVIHPENMKRNLAISRGLINSEAVMIELAKSLGRQKAHDVVYKVSMRAVQSGKPLREELAAEPDVSKHLQMQEIDRLLDPASYTGLAAQMVDGVLRAGNLR